MEWKMYSINTRAITEEIGWGKCDRTGPVSWGWARRAGMLELTDFGSVVGRVSL